MTVSISLHKCFQVNTLFFFFFFYLVLNIITTTPVAVETDTTQRSSPEAALLTTEIPRITTQGEQPSSNHQSASSFIPITDTASPETSDSNGLVSAFTTIVDYGLRTSPPTISPPTGTSNSEMTATMEYILQTGSSTVVSEVTLQTEKVPTTESAIVQGELVRY